MILPGGGKEVYQGKCCQGEDHHAEEEKEKVLGREAGIARDRAQDCRAVAERHVLAGGVTGHALANQKLP